MRKKIYNEKVRSDSDKQINKTNLKCFTLNRGNRSKSDTVPPL